MTHTTPYLDQEQTTTPMLRPAIQVLERANTLLDVLARHNQPMSLKSLAEQTGLHISTTHRILNDLVLARMIDRPTSGHYQLGMRLLELGNLVKARLNVRDVALPIMKTLHQQTRQTINLSMRQNDEIIYIERAVSERSGMQVVRAIGGRAPLHLTSVGKLFLAQDDKTALLSYATRTQLKGQTKNSITTLEKLHKELYWVRLHHVARDRDPALHLTEDRGAPRAEHLHEARRLEPGGGDPLGGAAPGGPAPSAARSSPARRWWWRFSRQ